MKKICLIILALFSITTVFAEPQYTIIVDAGSSGSRAHLFKYEPSDTLPNVRDIYSISVKPGLSAYANNPQAAGASLNGILTAVQNYLINNEHVDPHTVPINVLATAGMRLLPQDTQHKIYANVTQYMQQNFKFLIADVKTISGKEEGLYDWIDVNYLAKTFQNNLPTIGAIDMGGASTQIAFATHKDINSTDQQNIIINHVQYKLFIRSFLGLGQDQARTSMDKEPIMQTCYPHGYKINDHSLGDFNFPSCEVLYAILIAKHHVNEQIPILQSQSFIAFSGAYYDYQFFNVDKTPSQQRVESQIKDICYHSYTELKQLYPNVPDSYLSTYCANGTYINQLFNNTYHLDTSHLQVLNSINQQSIDWTLGAMVYKALN